MIPLKDLHTRVGETLPPSEWLTITQDMIDDFASVTGDHQWIHVDVDRCKKESPFGVPIAHGLLVLSLIAKMRGGVSGWAKFTSGLNYGSDKIRYPSPVRVGSRVRLHESLKSVEPYKDGAVKVTFAMTVELEGGSAPACYAELLAILFP